MKKIVILISLFFLGACSSTQKAGSKYTYDSSYNYDYLAKLHHKQSSSRKGYKYESQVLVPAHNIHWPEIAKKCRPMINEEGIKSFEFIFVLDEMGTVINIQSNINSNGVDCFLNEIKKISYPKPPYINWYEIVSVL